MKSSEFQNQEETEETEEEKARKAELLKKVPFFTPWFNTTIVPGGFGYLTVEITQETDPAKTFFTQRTRVRANLTIENAGEATKAYSATRTLPGKLKKLEPIILNEIRKAILLLKERGLVIDI